jgi:hypothetical protein
MQPKGSLEMSFDSQEFRAIGHHPEPGRSKAAAEHEFARPDRSKIIAFLLVGLLTTAVLSGCAGQNSEFVARIDSAYSTAFTVSAQPVPLNSATN